MTRTTIADTLAALARELPTDLPGRARILAEVEDHLAQSVEWQLHEGRSRQLAEREAVARFGDVAELAALLRSVAAERADGWRDEPLTGLQLAASWLSLGAGAVAAAGLIALAGWALLDPDVTAVAWPRALALLSAAVLAGVVGGMVMMRRRLDAAGRLRISAIGPLALLPLGTALVALTLQLGQATGDYEWYGAGIGLALVAQGALAAWLLRNGRRTAS